jgi:small subunit ribosomal protein S15
MTTSTEKTKKAQLRNQFARSAQDTGSAEVQCALLGERIKNLTQHLKIHKKDFSSRDGLMVLVARRKRLLKYLKKKSPKKYTQLVAVLGIKGNRDSETN